MSNAERQAAGRALAAWVALLALGAGGRATAADAPVAIPTQASPAAYDWTGFHVGDHLGYATGASGWSATTVGTAGPTIAGSLDLFNTYDMFKGTGSYFGGLQAGYDAMLPSRLLVGIETDVSFPNVIAGSQTLSSMSVGQASYAEAVELSGTARGRIGYAFNDWLVYATGGLAWSFDQLTRTQLSGAPAGGTAAPGTVESLLMVPRVGWVAGAGVEVALRSNWAARVEYLFTDFATRGVTFPAGASIHESKRRQRQPGAADLTRDRRVRARGRRQRQYRAI
jgi:high affinity Mn2+ porin